ncbi:assimilatory sulfite reductase (NADPH) flavoprotein subunit [Paraferrimonas sp. SM1919]|uniref:assimilatory sulfite reductase (NADPH) flavoprotein subunit n=1 Tax=Paraferrimonas sp. SM1919 TaxID=2662263 RepID=UPI0013D43F89|nr:assimilatory sulfite reductase (NADPH) flavoprotein subunit [Paraferrimonas sp. SM1919]
MLLKELNALGSPLEQKQIESLQSLVAELNPIQQAWVSGYLAASANQTSTTTVAAAPAVSVTLTILYASQTGNAQGVATALADQAKAKGFTVRLENIASYKVKELKTETALVIVASTHGEGDPPDDALEFHKFIHSKRAPKLDKLNYAVLGLGDSSYEFFCQTAKDFDQAFAKLGAKPLVARVDCDVDYDDAAKDWQQQAISAFKPIIGDQTQSAQVVTLPSLASSNYSRVNPYQAEVIVSQRITGRDSSKVIHHVELDLAGSGLSYQAGDSLGVYFQNDPELVTQLLKALRLEATSQVTLKNNELELKAALTDKLELTQLTPKVIEAWQQLATNDQLASLLADKDALNAYIKSHQFIELVSEFNAEVTAQQLVELLRPLAPRSYSIASAQQEVDEEVHLTVALVSEQRDGQTYQGGASSYLTQRVQEGDTLGVYVEPNKHFKLPENPDTPVIMIGPGTGIAPFRAFIQQRAASGANGKNWLFFGNPEFTQDFLYQVEWQKYVKDGLINNISLAFSRDQPHKIYVQHRIKEQASELYQWLQDGAHIYICGDKNRMAKDVEQALLEVITEQGSKSLEQAQQYLDELKSNKRYQKDVY